MLFTKVLLKALYTKLLKQYIKKFIQTKDYT